MGLLNGKVCLVTGAGGGIGSVICQEYALEGAERVIACEVIDGAVQKWCDSFSFAECIESYTADITSATEVRSMIQSVKRKYGRIDVLVNCAGIEYNENIGFIDHSHMQKMFEVNVFGLLETLQYSARLMMRAKSGSIINIASVVGVYGNPGQTVYSATKGAVISLTKSASKELAPYGIRVNAIAPGLTDTQMIRETSDEKLNERISKIALKRIAKPQDIANAAVFLASEKSSYITGQIMGVDGGTVL